MDLYERVIASNKTNLLERLLIRIGTKPGYKVIVGLTFIYMLITIWTNVLCVTGLVDSDNYVYATQTGTDEVKYLQTPIKLTNSNMVNFDTIKYK